MHERLIKCGLVSGCCGCTANHTQALCHSWSTSVKPRDLPHTVNVSSSSASVQMKGSFCLPQGIRLLRHLELNFTFCMHSLGHCTECGRSPNWDPVLTVSNRGAMSTARTGVAASVRASFRAWSTLREIKEKFSVLSWKFEWTLDL